MSKILKKFTEENGQNLQFNFIIFFCSDVIKFLKPVFHAWSPAHFVDNNQNSEKCVFLIIAVRSIFSYEIFGLTLFNKRLKDIHITKK